MVSILGSYYIHSCFQDAYELGKTTLLRALQTERSSVHELESVVASLQQNNSAISEMVDSRDMIIDELNNRIAVFEEDKVVLKAALRQLQKEMQEEAPKAQKLMDDLADSREGMFYKVPNFP
jgi:predicted nuclease with TOPRIM domain